MTFKLIPKYTLINERLKQSLKLGLKLVNVKFLSAPSRSFSSDHFKGYQSSSLSEEYISSFNLATHILEPWVKQQPDKPAVILAEDTKTETLTYSQFLEEAKCLASALCQGPSPSPRCSLVVLPKIIPWWIINVAGSLCDTIISPSTLMLSGSEILNRMTMCEADSIFCNSEVMDKIDTQTRDVPWRVLVEESEEKEGRNLREGWKSYHHLVSKGKTMPLKLRLSRGESIAQLFFTSGTTGKPKMVPQTQAAYGIGQRATAIDWLDLTPRDTLWNISDLGWAKAAYSSLYAPLIAGCTTFAQKTSKFDPALVLKTLEEVPVSVLCLPPSALRLLVQQDLSSFKPKKLRKCASAGEPLNPEILHTWRKYTGITIEEGYGQTESSLSATSAGIKVKPGALGKASGGYDIKIVDSDLKELGPNEEGEIAYSLKNGHPTGLFKGYLNDPEQTKKVFVGDYYLTGDRAFVDEDGYIFFLGRTDDIMKVSGYKISPIEVESVLIEHPAVQESAVVTSPDATRGNVLKAFVIVNDQNKSRVKTEEGRASLTKELQDFVKIKSAPYKYPRKIEFVDSLPKTVSGKIRRIELREKEKI